MLNKLILIGKGNQQKTWLYLALKCYGLNAIMMHAIEFHIDYLCNATGLVDIKSILSI